MKIPPVRIVFPEDDVSDLHDKISEILRSGQLILGKYTSEFEDLFSQFIGVNYGIAVNSGTSALEIALRSFGVEGREIIVPTNTNFATPAAVLHARATIKFVDVDMTTASISPQILRNSISPNTMGVIIVHIGGYITPDIEKIRKICRDNGLFLLEDAAHAHGSSQNGMMAGSLGDVGAFSFYPTKVITSAEGGMILTNLQYIQELAISYRDQGKQKFGRNFHTVLGNSWRMSEIHAAIGLSQFSRINEFISSRQRIARYYDLQLTDISGVSPFIKQEYTECNYYKYIVVLDADVSRDRLKSILAEKYSVRLSGEVYEIPCHQQPIFLNHASGEFSQAEKFCSSHICLPIYVDMTLDEADYVVSSLKASLSLV